VLSEIGGAVFLEGGTLFLGTEIVNHCSLGGLRSPELDTTRRVNPGGYFVGLALLAAYPLAGATGAYALGEIIDGRSANRGTAFGFTTLASYAQTLFLAYAAVTVRTGSEGESSAFVWAFGFDAATKPLLCTYVYNRVKEPAETSVKNPRPFIKPYCAATYDEDGRAVPLYGLTVSF
jgi:hypothetical protein